MRAPWERPPANPITEKEFPELIEELKGPASADRKREIAWRLAVTEPTDKQKERHKEVVGLWQLAATGAGNKEEQEEAESKDDVLKVSLLLNTLMQSSDADTVFAATAALSPWGTAKNATQKNIDDLIQRTTTIGRDDVRADACRALGKLKDRRGARAMAKMLEGNWSPDWDHAKKGFIAFGPDAEVDLLPYLQNPNPAVQKRAIGILQEIGTDKSMEPLQDLVRNSKLVKEANVAIDAIRSRNTTQKNKIDE
jgi:hypothetical protein